MSCSLSFIALSSWIAIGNLSAGEIEKSYWDCEFEATQWALDPGEAAMCSELYEHLKTERFGGDFDRLLAWWRENRERELSSRMKPGGLRPGR